MYKKLAKGPLHCFVSTRDLQKKKFVEFYFGLKLLLRCRNYKVFWIKWPATQACIILVKTSSCLIGIQLYLIIKSTGLFYLIYKSRKVSCISVEELGKR